jgi:hypothetical protein
MKSSYKILKEEVMKYVLIAKLELIKIARKIILTVIIFIV